VTSAAGRPNALRDIGVYAAFGSPFSVRAAEPLASSLAHGLTDLRIDDDIHAPGALTVAYDAEEWTVSWGGRKGYSGPDENAALHGALAAINMHAARTAAGAGCAVLHAGAVAVGGSAVAFVGHSRAGKSTFTAAMVRAGHAYLADEVVAVGADRIVQPFHRPIGVRTGAARLLELGVPGGSDETIHPYRVGGDHRLAAGTPLRLIAVLRRSGDAPLRLEPISSGQALYELCSQTLGATGLERSVFRRIDELVRRTPAVVLHYHDVVTSISTVADRVAAIGASEG